MMSSFGESSDAVTTSLMTKNGATARYNTTSIRAGSLDDEIMTSSSHARTNCCDVTSTLEQQTMISKSRSDNKSVVEFATDAFVAVTRSSDGNVFTSSSLDSNGGMSRDVGETGSVTKDRERDVTAKHQQTVQTHTTSSVTSYPTDESVLQWTSVDVNHQMTREEDSLRRDLTPPSLRHAVTLDDANDTSSPLSSVTLRITDTFSLIDARTSRVDSWPPLALRFSADNASASAAVGSDRAVNRRAGSARGLLREEVVTVGAAVAGVVVFWTLLAFTMYAIVRLRKRKKRRRLCGGDVDAQTAMMEAMVRAELARGRSRVSDSRIPTYVNVTELIPRSSSSCDLDMSDLFHYVFDSNHSDVHGIRKKQRYRPNDVVYGRSRDHWQDGSRTIQPATRLTTTHNNLRQLTSREDHHCLLNDTNNLPNGQLQSNGGVLTRVKSLDSVCKAADEAIVETKHRQRPRRRRVRRSASTSRCLVSANNKPPSANSPADGDITKCHNDVTGCANDVSESVNMTPRPEIKDEPTDITRTPEAARQGDKMALPELTSLDDREPTAVMSPLSQHETPFSSRTCAPVSRSMQATHRAPQPLYRHVTPYRVMTSSGRYPPPPPPPLPGHVMRLFASPNMSGRPSRFPRMGHTGLATSTSQRTTLQTVRPDDVAL